MSANVNFQTPERTLEELDRIAEQLERDRSWVINEAIGEYLETQRWQTEHIRQGIADTDAGRTLSTEEVRKRLQGRHLATQQRASDTLFKNK